MKPPNHPCCIPNLPSPPTGKRTYVSAHRPNLMLIPPPQRGTHSGRLTVPMQVIAKPEALRTTVSVVFRAAG